MLPCGNFGGGLHGNSLLMGDEGLEEVRRHTFLQEEARMLSAIYKAEEQVGNEWRKRADCRNDRDHSWFAPEQTVQAAEAADICFSCPVRTECLLWASVSKQRYGIWGGLPASVRIPKGSSATRRRPHNFRDLRVLGNPYRTEDSRSKFHQSKLTQWNGEYDDE